MLFDGVSKSPMGAQKEDAQDNVAGVRFLFVSPNDVFILYSFSLIIRCSTNMAEYEAVFPGLELTLQRPVTSLTIYGDWELVVKQLMGEYSMKKMELVPYHKKVEQP